MVHRGWAGNISLADDIFSESVRTNGVVIGVAGPKRRIQECLAGFRDLSVDIEDMFSAHDKIVARLVWRGTHAGSYAGIKAVGKRVQVPDFAIWRFEHGKVVEKSTIQDQFTLLKQIGYLPGDVYAAQPPRRPALPGAAWLSRTCTEGAGRHRAAPAGASRPAWPLPPIGCGR